MLMDDKYREGQYTHLLKKKKKLMIEMTMVKMMRRRS